MPPQRRLLGRAQANSEGMRGQATGCCGANFWKVAVGGGLADTEEPSLLEKWTAAGLLLSNTSDIIFILLVKPGAQIRMANPWCSPLKLQEKSP